ncbi:MAG: adenosylmethionine--8-amino-7-oxononanoate transaminase [Verrucomicrobiota bacterium JB023]|nr:adenosylmethionine--8-amino-7-oxononanoate transaminase [Verrucomicrobiota bacterium JB023]
MKSTRELLEADWRHAWHPFTDQSLWEGVDSPVIVRGEGVWLEDSEGRRYYDGNSSIWTNIHGHSHPALVEALREQAGTLCHSSYLGLANARASELAMTLSKSFSGGALQRVFFSDNGSTALEVALRMELQWRWMRGEKERRKVVAFENAYHGDTLGAASLGGVGRFFEAIAGLGVEVEQVGGLAGLLAVDGDDVAAVVIEPVIQGVNEMTPWPTGMLKSVRAWCDEHGAHLICDEVMTGFGRTGALFACELEEVVPDYLCLAKGLTGGTMPLAATLTREVIYEDFKGPGKTLYYGHSYTANPLGCAVALASLELCQRDGFLLSVREKGELMGALLKQLSSHPSVKAVRRVGMVSGIELAGDGSSRGGKALCKRLRERGLLTRPILDTVVWMPPLASTRAELQAMGHIFQEALSQELSSSLS